jgi:hypothetical protein
MFIRCFIQLNLVLLELLQPRFQGCELAAEVFGFDLRHGKVLTICNMERGRVAIDAGLDLLPFAAGLDSIEVAIDVDLQANHSTVDANVFYTAWAIYGLYA